ncbi:MAG: hypothetical protein KGI64_05885 [Xanthomonadaceae bacterium]|nr:hypothetical protein [Xanthomonadaceae bacterium]MDE1886496.1 hypothetical protein [Xanthomonadaceae bacterium]MDE2084373.1 hypothetical protein [Xanthomonadaceae bacterium]MDE2256595.1 hypothetical protein [Xanthomonadaceae bacterium]
MTICPVALAVGCKRCPVFAICPAKTLIGDYRPDAKKAEKTEPKAAGKPRR